MLSNYIMFLLYNLVMKVALNYQSGCKRATTVPNKYYYLTTNSLFTQLKVTIETHFKKTTRSLLAYIKNSLLIKTKSSKFDESIMENDEFYSLMLRLVASLHRSKLITTEEKG